MNIFSKPNNAVALDAAMRDFCNRWAPHYGGNLEADLFRLIQLVYLVAQEPFVKACADAVARQPMPAFVVNKAEMGK